MVAAMVLTALVLATLFSQAPDVLQAAPCARQGAEYVATLEGTLRLHRAFLDPALGDDENARLAVTHQIKYVWGWLRTNPVSKRTLRAVLSAEAPRMDVTLREGTYGRDLALPYEVTGQHLVIKDVYTQRAVAAGKTTAADPALLVDYRIHFKVALCGPNRPDASTLTVPLPPDPWLFFWHVPAQHHKVMRYKTYTARTNPCSDDDFAELPHPFYYWYDWWPNRRGTDELGARYDCSTLMTDGVDYKHHDLQLARVALPSANYADWVSALKKDQGTLRGTLLFGVQDHDVKTLDHAPLRAALGDGVDLSKRAAALLDKDEPEIGLGKALRFLKDLPEVMYVSNHRTTITDGYLVVELDGVLRKSRRGVVLRVLYGFSDVFGPVPPNHWNLVRRALSQDHVVVYVGHSGIGENLKLEQISQHTNTPKEVLLEELGRAPYQAVAFLSCYSYMYFGRDFMEAGPAGRAFVYTGNEYTKGDRGGLALLALLDQVASGVQSPQLRWMYPEDFLLVKAYRPR